VRYGAEGMMRMIEAGLDLAEAQEYAAPVDITIRRRSRWGGVGTLDQESGLSQRPACRSTE
jgi:hypothetical protein